MVIRTTVLVTAFEPFGQDRENASHTAVDLLTTTWEDPDITLVTGLLPVVFATAGDGLEHLVSRHRPDAVLAVGEAGGRTRVTPESTARNLDDARIPDNAGAQPQRVPIDPTGPPTLRATLDVEAVVAACLADAIAAEVSADAGGFLCNHVFHHLLRNTDVPAGFIHVPALRSTGRATVGAETDPVPGDTGTDVEPEVTLDQCARALAHAVRIAASQAPPRR